MENPVDIYYKRKEGRGKVFVLVLTGLCALHFTHSCSCNKQCLRHWDAHKPLRGLALLPSNCFLKSFAIFLENIRVKSFLEKILEHYDVKCNENVHKFMKKYNPHWTFTLIIDIIQNSSEFIRFRTKQCKTERSPL